MKRWDPKIQQQIATILLRDWDPMGVSDIPEAHGEYDSYVGPIYRLLVEGASAETLGAHLQQIERVEMDLYRAGERALAFDKLLELGDELNGS